MHQKYDNIHNLRVAIDSDTCNFARGAEALGTGEWFTTRKEELVFQWASYIIFYVLRPKLVPFAVDPISIKRLYRFGWPSKVITSIDPDHSYLINHIRYVTEKLSSLKKNKVI